MAYDVTKLLGDPNPGITLDELAKELNELAKLRDSARLAFCKRLAVVYLMIVGHPPHRGVRAPSFYRWCSANIRSASGKQYTFRTLSTYVTVGFAKNPQKFMRERDLRTQTAVQNNIGIARAIKQAVAADSPPKVIPITTLKERGLPTDVAREVNALMTAWEQASSQARSQFMYIVTGKRIAA